MANKPSDDSKVMDVSKPGKGKIVVNSRPVVAPVVSDTAPDSDIGAAPESKSTEAGAKEQLKAPSTVRKVIQPIAIKDDEANEKDEADQKKDAPEDTPDQAKTEPEAAEESTSSSDVVPESSDSIPTPKPDEDNPIAPDDSNSENDGAASVDEMAKAAEAKRLTAAKTKEQEERDQKAQELIKSKQYFVPISHASHSSKKTLRNAGITLLLLVALAVAGYFAYTAGLFGNMDDNSSNTASTGTDAANESEEVKKDGENADEEQPAEQTEDTDQTLAPLAKGNDEDRKNELKNLQQKLEVYFSDNGQYPAALSELEVETEEITGPTGDAYTYTPAAVDGVDNMSYTLSAQLEDTTDEEADENGLYTIQSLNS